VATIDSGPSGNVTETSATFTFSADKPVTGFECGFDFEYEPCTSPQTHENLALGAHTFEVRAIDRFDHFSLAAASRDFIVVDSTPPETTILTGPPASSTATSAEFTFESNEDGSTFQCSLDDALFSTCISPHQVTGLEVGAHSFRVRAIDPWGNLGPTPASHPFTVETTGPGPDDSVIATVTAAKVQKIKGRKVVVAVKVKAEEALTVKASGTAEKGKAKVTFKPVSRKLKAGQASTFRLKPAKARAGKKLAAALKGGKRTTPKLLVTMTDGAMNRLVKRPKVKLVGSSRRR
jgi:predicted phage tail protein